MSVLCNGRNGFEGFQALFPNDVQLIFKQFPLRSIHPEAQLAGKHPSRPWNKVSFGNTTTSFLQTKKKLFGKDLEIFAEQIGLDMVKFRAALDSGKHKAAIETDMREGSRAGVSGTPAVYMNGRKYQGPRGFPPEGLEGIARSYLGIGL